MNVFEIIDRDQYEWCVENKYIKTQTHPLFLLVIHNYTDSCIWEHIWNPATLTCRGLITDVNGEIVARSFSKFFNFEELGDIFKMDDRITVMDKVDGSLGILYPLPDGTYAISTRGSFVSEQAIWATNFFNKKYPDFKNEENITFLFEIIYPENRIVVDYRGEERLVLLGAIENDSGRYINPNQFYQFDDVVQIFPFTTYQQMIYSSPRSNAEGFVFFHHRTNQLVKFKYEEYKMLHKIVTGLNEKHIWEEMMLGESIEEKFQGVPDEFHKWIIKVSDEIRENYQFEKNRLILEYKKIRHSSSDFDNKKNFAMSIYTHPDKSIFFALYNDKDIREMVWKKVKPN
jgi:RNA ligase